MSDIDRLVRRIEEIGTRKQADPEHIALAIRVVRERATAFLRLMEWLCADYGYQRICRALYASDGIWKYVSQLPGAYFSETGDRFWDFDSSSAVPAYEDRGPRLMREEAIRFRREQALHLVARATKTVYDQWVAAKEEEEDDDQRPQGTWPPIPRISGPSYFRVNEVPGPAPEDANAPSESQQYKTALPVLTTVANEPSQPEKRPGKKRLQLTSPLHNAVRTAVKEGLRGEHLWARVDGLAREDPRIKPLRVWLDWPGTFSKAWRRPFLRRRLNTLATRVRQSLSHPSD